MKKKTAVIIGAGPAGLTAAYELINKTDIKPIVFETTNYIGGLSRTVDYKGNKLDIGGHRFFSKSERILEWWNDILPIQSDGTIDPEKSDEVMLIRKRLSRIFFLNKLFNYPIKLNLDTFVNLGFFRTSKIFASYIKTRLSREGEIETLEDLFIHRFGKELYQTFFRDYTEKVWGVSCKQIKPEWGSQRIKNLSVGKTILHALKENFLSLSSVPQKSTETSLIQQFLYPKYGPGQMWEKVADRIQAMGGRIVLEHRVVGLHALKNDKSFVVEIEDQQTGNIDRVEGNYVFSTMPVKELVASLKTDVPSDVLNYARGLVYRDFIIVGILLNKLKMDLADQWIYIQENLVKLGRLQIFNNWSPYMALDPSKMWIGSEYFCTEGDALWNMSDEEMKKFAVDELEKIHFIDQNDVIDAVIIKQPKAYPAYFGSYDYFPVIRNYLDQFENLFLIGRNGMHRYNNQDHSMMSAMMAVENIINNVKTKENIWDVNTEEELHEVK